MKPISQTMLDKLWTAHAVLRREDGVSLLWIDRHLVHEGSPHAFAKLKERGLSVCEPDLTFAFVDHYAPTRRSFQTCDPKILGMIQTLRQNTHDHGVRLYDLDDPRQGIAHVVGPEEGLTLPGLLINCGDSHTSTHGAFGALAFGIGATEVAHVLATQTIWQRKPKSMRISVEGALGFGVAAKDIALGWIGKLGTDGAQGYAVESELNSSVDFEPRYPLTHPLDKINKVLFLESADKERVVERAFSEITPSMHTAAESAPSQSHMESVTSTIPSGLSGSFTPLRPHASYDPDIAVRIVNAIEKLCKISPPKINIHITTV